MRVEKLQQQGRMQILRELTVIPQQEVSEFIHSLQTLDTARLTLQIAQRISHLLFHLPYRLLRQFFILLLV